MADDSKNGNPVDDDLVKITAMAKRLGLAGKDASDYVHDHMTRLGYKSRRSYFKTAKSSDGGNRPWWRGKDDGDDDNDNDEE